MDTKLADRAYMVLGAERQRFGDRWNPYLEDIVRELIEENKRLTKLANLVDKDKSIRGVIDSYDGAAYE
jgi:hypothetical protein